MKNSVAIPVAMKLSPFFSSFSHVAQRLVTGGADGLVLFNRFYQPDINLESLEVEPGISLSSSFAMRLPMRWIAILYGRMKVSLAATSGIHTAEDVLKMLMAGADVTMMCSALLKNGPEHITRTLQDMERWMLDHEYISAGQMKGSMSHKSVADPAAFSHISILP